MEHNLNIIAGNSFLIWWGRLLFKIADYLTKKSTKAIEKGTELTILNPSAVFHNPFLLIISFTINSNKKFQLVMEGSFSEMYVKNEGKCVLTEDELYLLIRRNQSKWFHKTLEI